MLRKNKVGEGEVETCYRFILVYGVEIWFYALRPKKFSQAKNNRSENWIVLRYVWCHEDPYTVIPVSSRIAEKRDQELHPLHLPIPQNSAKFRRLSTLPQYSPLEQRISYSPKEFLHEYEKRTKENQENMRQRVSSAENKFLYFIVAAGQNRGTINVNLHL
ncbi:hypothetical protein Glove_71g136 [Diversispora epigaea]|uniref:Uncharacterized protein n=1 Tax=Diversispora epigaea TaxID=1348612 RepID=A0A397JDG0_9GLOM|nr:hypothetical protein Glove_71g136 [Diversispora epigaea]